MKKYDFMLIAMLLLFAACAIRTNAQDLSLRTSIYFTGEKTDSIDLVNDPWVAQGKKMTLKISQAVSHQHVPYYTFNLGVRISRTGGTMNKSLMTYGLMSSPGGTVGENAYFDANVPGVDKVYAVNLKVGSNEVTFTIDPYNEIVESNENNNTFTVTIDVVTGFPPIRAPKKVDLTTTNRFYLLAEQKTTAKLDPATDESVAAKLHMILFGKNAMHCGPPNDNGTVECVFMVGFVAQKNVRVDLPVNTSFEVFDHGLHIFSEQMDFAAGEQTKNAQFKLTLSKGDHALMFMMDPKYKVAEEDENNNSFVVYVKVE